MAAHHRRAIRFHTDKNKKALPKIPQKNKKAVSGRFGFRVMFYLYILGHFGQVVFYRDYYNYSSVFVSDLCLFYVFLITPLLTIHLVKPWSIWSTVWSIFALALPVCL